MLSGGGDIIIQVPLERAALKLQATRIEEVGIWSSTTPQSPTCRARPHRNSSKWPFLAWKQGYIQHFGMLSNEQMAMFDNMFFNISAEDVPACKCQRKRGKRGEVHGPCAA